MSRVGEAPVEVPAGVEINIQDNILTAKGPKGNLSHEIPRGIKANLEDGKIVVERESDEKQVLSLHGLTRSLIYNVVEGVSKGFEKDLELIGVGYRASKKGNNLELQVGFSKAVTVKTPDGIEFEVPAPTKIKVKGINKQLVGQVAANIRSVRPPEPYKGKGIRYAGEYVRRKAGKAAKV